MSHSHYSVIEDKRLLHNKLMMSNRVNNLPKKPAISVQNRPLPPLPPPRKSQLSVDKYNNQRSSVSLKTPENMEVSVVESSDSCVKSDHETNSVSSIYEQISPRKCVKNSVIVRTSKLQCHQSGIPTPSFSMAELATRFLEENVRNCIKPRIFPMEAMSPFNERVAAPYIFRSADTTRIHHQRRLIIAPSLAMDGFLATKTAVVSKTRSLTTSLNSFSQQNLEHSRQRTRMNNTTVSSSNPHAPAATSTAAVENGSPAKKSNGSRSDFASILRKWSAPIPPTLSRKLGRASESPLGKVKVMLRVCDNAEEVSGSGILGLDKRRKQVTLIDPGGTTPSGITPQERRVGISAPKMFAFDCVFEEDDDQGEICAASAAELVASVVGGEDGCFVSLGYCSAGKKQTMFGKAANQKMGAVPTAISWLFKSILEQKQKTSSRFSVRVSAVEVTGGSGHEVINDLLLPFVNDGDDPPGALLENAGGVSATNSKSISAPVLNSVSEVRAPNPETAGFFLDSALDTIHNKEEPMGHFVFTLHVYQYSVDKNGKGVAGGRSRLHCVMLGNGSPSISVLGGLLLAVLNGQRHLPSSNHSKLGAILRECLGSLTCRAVVMIHVSNAHARYAETLAALQLGARVHRLRRSRRLKMGSVGSGNGSGGSSGGSGEETRNVIGLNNQVGEGDTGSSDIDPSSSEQSCDTVIYLGPSIDEATDGEHPPYLPSLETTPGENSAKIIPSKCSILSGPNGIPPKTKSPKPKSSKITPEGNFGTTNGKSEEQWVDGPKLAKYRHPNGNHSSSNTTSAIQSPAKKKGETWIDGPAARVQHQSSNFPSPKKTLASLQQQRSASNPTKSGNNYSNGNGHGPSGRSGCDMPNSPAVCISATKAEMIQKWISNQTPTASDLFDETPTHKNLMDTYFAGQENGLHSNGGGFTRSGHLALPPNATGINAPTIPVTGISSNAVSCAHQGGNHSQFGSFYTCHCVNHDGNLGPIQLSTEPDYKALTVFKTCDDSSMHGDDHPSICEGYDFEFIEVVEPEIPVPTRDACLQVTEEDIALSFLEENPLPESDQNFSMPAETYFSRGRSSSFSEISSCPSSNSMPKLEKDDDHPLRVLSQECLTVVSTFADSISVAGDMERFWPRLTFPTDVEMSQNISMCHGLCQNLTSPGKTSSSLSTCHTLSNKLEQMSTQNNKPPSSLLLRDLPILSDESIFKVPSVAAQQSTKLSRISTIHPKKYLSGKESSDTEAESIKIPPMDLIDTTPITSSCSLPNENTTTQVQSITIALPTQPNHQSHQLDGRKYEMYSVTQRPISENNHSSDVSRDIGNTSGNNVLQANGVCNGASNSAQSSPSRGTLTPPSTPSPVAPLKLPDVTKSPSKSKSRKISKFFRTRSKSPKTAGATSSSESGKSSLGSDAKLSSSSSSCSSGMSAPLTNSTKQKCHSSPKHMSPSRHLSPSKKQSASRKNSCFSTTSSSTDYHFTCDSVIPMFLPNPNQGKKIVGSTDLAGSGVIIPDLGLVKTK